MDAQALGRFLRQTREAKELTLEDAERTLKIRQRVLESFELGDFNIPDSSVVQIRGFIRNYSRYLGLEEDRIVQFYEAIRTGAVNAPKRKSKKNGKSKRESQPSAPTAARSITDTNPALPAIQLAEPKRKGGGFLSVLVRLLVAAAAIAVIAFVAIQIFQQQNAPILPPPASNDILNQLPASPTDTPAPTLTTVSLLPTLLPEAQTAGGFNGQGVMVVVEATQRTWLQVTTDGVQQYAGIATPGTRIEIPAKQTVVLSASNAAALSVTWNGQKQRAFGGRGQKVDITFTATDVNVVSGPAIEPTSPYTATPLPTDSVNVQASIQELTPSNTPGPSPTPSDTPPPTETPTITLTPSDTPTITLTPTITPSPSLTRPPTMTPIPSLTPSETASPTLTHTPTATSSPTATRTPTLTPSATITLTPSQTAILPPRVPLVSPTPTKNGA